MGEMDLRLQGILFDLDGVLIDSGRDIMHAVNWTLCEHGLSPLPYETVKRHVGHGAGVLLARCFAEFGPRHEALAEQALPAYKSRYLAYSVVETALYEGVSAGLAALRAAGFRMAVVTNKPGALAQKILETLGVWQVFDLLVPPEELTRIKPDPEGLLLAMTSLGLQPEGTVMVGDTWSDMEAGKRAGTRTFGALWGLGDPQAVCAEKPDGTGMDFPSFVQWALSLK